MVDAVPEEMIDAMAAAGSVDDVRARVAEAEKLFDHVVVYPPSFGLTAQRCDELAKALVAHLAPDRSGVRG
jgi:predicted RNA methylase